MLSWQNYEGPKMPYEKRQKLEKNCVNWKLKAGWPIAIVMTRHVKL